MPPAPALQPAPDLSGNSLSLNTTAAKNATAGAAPTTKQAVVVTSAPARQVTADNIAKLQSITTLPATTAAPTTDSKGGSSGVVINNNPAPTSTTLAEDQARAANQGKPGYDVFGDPVKTTATATNTDGTPDYDASVKGISDPAIAAQYKSSLQTLDQEIKDAHDNLDAAKATAINDPAATAMIDSIKAKFAVQIDAMKAKNDQYLGKVNSSVAAFGGLGPMSQGFLNDEQSKADARIADVVAKENDAVLKAQIAFQTKDYKALNDAMTSYTKANADKLKALNDLLSATDKQVKQQQAQAKQDAAAEKQAVALDISKSTNLATGIVKEVADAGLTDQGQIDQYIQSMADQYGITNPDILKSAVEKARQASIKSLAGTANTLSTIQKRSEPKAAPKGSIKGSGTDGTYKYAQSDVDSYSGFLNEGGTDPSGTTYNGRGDDGYVDPGAYTAAMGDWVKNGGTPAGFASKFPVKKNINPASYEQLPAVIRPKAAASAAVIPQ